MDDEPDVLSALRRTLQAEHDVVLACGGADALARLRGGERFDVVLCDLAMPDVSGTDVFASAAVISPALAERFVFMTAGAFTPEMQGFLATIENGNLQKPFEPAELRCAIDAAARRT